jgi:hypothetical protein
MNHLQLIFGLFRVQFQDLSIHDHHHHIQHDDDDIFYEILLYYLHTIVAKSQELERVRYRLIWISVDPSNNKIFNELPIRRRYHFQVKEGRIEFNRIQYVNHTQTVSK